MKLFNTYKQLLHEELIKEGVYDPHIFKAIFLAGSPGAGKSYVYNNVLKGFGLKHIDSDSAFVYFLKKAQMSTNIANMSADESDEANSIRRHSISLTTKRGDLFYEGRLGVVLDATGRDFSFKKEQNDQLKALGYDTCMIYVNTSLEVALKRNSQRERVLPDDIVKRIWHNCQDNIGSFQILFGASNFHIIDNSGNNTDTLNYTYKEIKKWLESPPNNHIARTWIEKELMSKNKNI